MTPDAPTLQPWQTYLAEHKEAALADLMEFLRIPSISAQQHHRADMTRAAEWVAGRLRSARVENVQVMATAGYPVVYGDWLHAPGKPVVAIYGHYDVQPVDPVNLWTSPPFEPAVRDGRIYARGSGDDKGNMLMPILVAEAFLRTQGALPVNLKFIFEGEEEVGSANFPEFVAANRDLLAADLVLSADGSQESEQRPSLLVALRGLLALQIDVYGAKTDLHSGLYGGAVANPIHALVRILDSLRAPDGTITVPGFFDDVIELTGEERDQIAAVPFDEREYFAELDLDGGFGEPGYTCRERLWARPTLELNGIWGGFEGEGSKTVLPCEAHAKITCRLVADQDPDRVYEAIAGHVRRTALEQTPGVRVEVVQQPGKAFAYLIPPDHPANRLVGDVLTSLYGNPPYYVRMGASVGALVTFQRELGAYTVTLGFTLHDERHHAPDEYFRLASFEKGQQAYGLVWQAIAKQGSTS